MSAPPPCSPKKNHLVCFLDSVGNKEQPEAQVGKTKLSKIIIIRIIYPNFSKVFNTFFSQYSEYSPEINLTIKEQQLMVVE